MNTKNRARHLPPSTGIRRIREVDYAPHEVQRPHEHAHASVTLILRGDVEESVDGATSRGGALSVVIKPAELRHADRVGPHGLRTLQIEFEPASAPQAKRPREALSAWRWLPVGVSVRPFMLLAEELRSGAPEDSLATAVYDTLAALPMEPCTSISGPPPRWLSRVEDEIAATFVRPRPVSTMAQATGMHPVSLARAFRRHYGVSITERIRSLRVRAAADLLGDRHNPVAAIAQTTGFSDQAHFSRVFRATTGVTPTRYRHLMAV